ncbi:MAG: hypothetical protein ACOCXX_05450, partial [Planctomycetota bacterium]
MRRIALASVFLAVLATGLGLQAGLIETRMATQTDQRNIARDVDYPSLSGGFYADSLIRNARPEDGPLRL